MQIGVSDDPCRQRSVCVTGHHSRRRGARSTNGRTLYWRSGFRDWPAWIRRSADQRQHTTASHRLHQT